MPEKDLLTFIQANKHSKLVEGELLELDNLVKIFI